MSEKLQDGKSLKAGLPTFSIVAVLICILMAAALAYKPFREKLSKIEYWTSDWRTVFLADRTLHEHAKIVIVTFNYDTFGGEKTPIPRDFHAQVIQAIDAMQPRAIGLDFYFLQAQSEEADRKFIKAIRDAKAPVVVGAVDKSATQFVPSQFEYQKKFLANAGRASGYINLQFDSGNVVRVTSPPLDGSQFRESFAYQLAKRGGADVSGIASRSASIRIAWLVGPNFDTQPFTIIPAQDILKQSEMANGNETTSAIKDKIVLTGIDFPYLDDHETPFTVWSGKEMKGVMIHAQVIAQLLDGRYLHDLTTAGRNLFLGATGLIGFILSWLFWRRPLDVTGLGVATVVLVGLDAVSFSIFRTALPLFFALYIWFIAVTLGHHVKSIIWWLKRPSKLSMQN